MPPPRQMSESANPRHFRQEVSALKRELAALKTESMASDSRHRHMTVSLNHQLQALQKQNHDFQETAEHLQSVIANLRSRLRETRNVAAAAKARADTAESLAERRRLALQGEKNNESVRNQAHGRYEQVLASQLKKVTTEKKALAQECSSMSTECSQLRAALKVAQAETHRTRQEMQMERAKRMEAKDEALRRGQALHTAYRNSVLEAERARSDHRKLVRTLNMREDKIAELKDQLAAQEVEMGVLLAKVTALRGELSGMSGRHAAVAADLASRAAALNITHLQAPEPVPTKAHRDRMARLASRAAGIGAVDREQ
ncbi:hypothetical protein KIPB_001747 [Kipferlia bialata]|uniref:Uncharacterized protein n=1 Tax=Kipferlia bialata TaxID=797122 RepID=A0A9K3CRF5_9EUKA|nr:hypothetical protein KIPB_001747 [Kipferlia bialata]|eukprot:g1747.t1